MRTTLAIPDDVLGSQASAPPPRQPEVTLEMVNHLRDEGY